MSYAVLFHRKFCQMFIDRATLIIINHWLVPSSKYHSSPTSKMRQIQRTSDSIISICVVSCWRDWANSNSYSDICCKVDWAMKLAWSRNDWEGIHAHLNRLYNKYWKKNGSFAVTAHVWIYIKIVQYVEALKHTPWK